MTDNDDLSGLITDPRVLTAKIAEWKAKGHHVVSPANVFTSFAPHYGANISALVLDADDVYQDPALMKANERAIGARGLDKIAALAKLSWLQSSCRTDLRTIQRLWEYRADAAYISYDGTPLFLNGTSEVDLRDGSDQIGGWTPAGWAELVAKNAKLPDNQKKEWSIGGWSDRRVAQARRFGLRLCETKAKSAAIRTLGIKSKYTVEELAHPFVVLHFQYIPDMEDADARRQVVMAGIRGVGLLYAGTVSAARELPESTGADVIDIEAVRKPEPVPVIQGAKTTGQTLVVDGYTVPPSRTTTPAKPATTPAPTKAAPPATSSASTVVLVEVKKTGKSDRGAWVLTRITLSDGRYGDTFSTDLSKKAMDARDDKIGVREFVVENEGNYTTLKKLELVTEPENVKLPLGEVKL